MKIASRLLATVLALLVFATGCGKEPEPVEPESIPEQRPAATRFINAMSGVELPSSPFPRYVKQVREKYELNSDTVGWLDVPGTHINDVVVCRDDPNDLNKYYYRRNFQKEWSFNGLFYADFRNRFGEGKADELSKNTVIYGHTMSEDYNGVMFAPIYYFTSEDFAKETPYIYFSTMKEDLVWEVFSVFYSTVSLPYNRPDLEPQAHAEMIKEVRARSLYNYDTEVTADDKLLTLSTCTYRVPGVGKVSYPNNYRYVIMAKMVSRADADKTEAAFTKNPAPKAP